MTIYRRGVLVLRGVYVLFRSQIEEPLVYVLVLASLEDSVGFA